MNSLIASSNTCRVFPRLLTRGSNLAHSSSYPYRLRNQCLKLKYGSSSSANSLSITAGLLDGMSSVICSNSSRCQPSDFGTNGPVYYLYSTTYAIETPKGDFVPEVYRERLSLGDDPGLGLKISNLFQTPLSKVVVSGSADKQRSQDPAFGVLDGTDCVVGDLPVKTMYVIGHDLHRAFGQFFAGRFVGGDGVIDHLASFPFLPVQPGGEVVEFVQQGLGRRRGVAVPVAQEFVKGLGIGCAPGWCLFRVDADPVPVLGPEFPPGGEYFRGLLYRFFP